MTKYNLKRGLLAIFFILAGAGFFFLNDSKAKDRDIIASYNFEDGLVPSAWNRAYSAFRAKYPVAVYKESNGNYYIRITATDSDNFSNGGNPLKLRSELSVAPGSPGWSSVEANRSVTYSYSIRLPNDGSRFPESNVNQFGATLIGDPPQFMPALRLFWDETKGFWLRNQYESTDGKISYQSLEFGRIGLGKWGHFSVSVYWTMDPAKAKIIVYVDGKYAGTMSGLPTVASYRSPNGMQFEIGTYGVGAKGSVDFDNVVVRMGLTPIAPPGGSGVQ
jgi:hypothetical protein